MEKKFHLLNADFGYTIVTVFLVYITAYAVILG